MPSTSRATCRRGGEATRKTIGLTEATKPLADYVKEMDGMSIMIMYKGYST